MSLNAGFIFLAPEADYQTDRQTIETKEINLTVIGAKDYADAAKAAQELEAIGVTAIELCAGFGIEGVAQMKRAVSKNVAIGVVRFDFHPGLDFQTGDDIF